MQLASLDTIPTEHRLVCKKVKAVVNAIDPSSTIILFGSRVRGDATEESDWDFLVLTKNENVEGLAWDLRRAIRIEVEMKFDIAVSLIVKNNKLWEEDYAVTNIYQSIEEEGVVL